MIYEVLIEAPAIVELITTEADAEHSASSFAASPTRRTPPNHPPTLITYRRPVMLHRRRRHRRPPKNHTLSIYEPIPFGIDENGQPVAVTLMYRNLLAGGEPGSGKSSLLNTIIAHAVLCCDVKLWLFDGKIVELGLWRPVADTFVGNDIRDALDKLRQLQAEMDLRYRQLDAAGRRKIVRTDGLDVILCVIDELAYFSVTIGAPAELASALTDTFPFDGERCRQTTAAVLARLGLPPPPAA